jgi:hypothetical protein
MASMTEKNLENILSRPEWGGHRASWSEHHLSGHCLRKKGMSFVHHANRL